MWKGKKETAVEKQIEMERDVKRKYEHLFFIYFICKGPCITINATVTIWCIVAELA